MAFWNCVEPIRTPRLDRAVENAYRVFSDYELRRPLIACHCDACMSADNAEALLKTPLRQISSELLAEYTNSAHGYDPVNVAPQMKYFLPRYLDLIADCKPPHQFEPSSCLARLARAHWRAQWPAAEVAAMEEFFDAFLDASLNRLELDGPPAHPRLVFGLADFLALVLLAGGDADRLLEAWRRSPDPNAALHVASLRLSAIEHNGTEWCIARFFNDFPELSRAIARWAMSDDWTTRIEAAFFAADRPEHQQLLSDALAISA